MPKNRKLAVRKLGKMLDIPVSRQGKTWYITPDGSPLATTMSTVHALAFLADLARHAGLDPAEVEYTGTVPARGLASWEEDAYTWLTGGRT